MLSKKWKTSERNYGVAIDRDVKIKVSDGVLLNSYVFRPDSEGKFPAILGIVPYLPTQGFISHQLKPKASTPNIRGTELERPNSPLECGDPYFYACRGYVHMTVSVRGTGASEGLYQFRGEREVQDVYDAVEWAATQKWCNGNVGMFGASYFAISQLLGASLNPPHLKCIFAPWAQTDTYRDSSFHNGIVSMFGLIWSRNVWYNKDPRRYSLEELGEEGLKKALAAALKDPELNSIPEVLDILKNYTDPKNAVCLESILHKLDGPFWEQRRIKTERIKVPSYLGADWHQFWLHLPGALRSWATINAPKKMTIGPPNYMDRPVYQMQYESLRWFDYWLKGIDTGIMDEPPIKLFLLGTPGEWKTATEWPLPETKWTPFYLHENKLLSEHEFWENEAFDTFNDSPWGRENVEYFSPPLVERTEIIGPIVLTLYASSTDTEVLWFAGFRDVDEKGNEAVLTRGWLRGSQRKVDPARSTPWMPYLSHTESEPLVPNQIYEFKIPIIATANVFMPGHRIGIKIGCADDPVSIGRYEPAHVRRQASSRVTVYHDENHPSNLLLPITRGNVIGTFMSGGHELPRTKS